MILHRIEHKLDLILWALMDKGIMLEDLPPLEGVEDDVCPVCKAPYRALLDLKNESVVLECACRLPVSVVPGISALMQPPKEKSDAHPDDEAGSGVPPEEEEGGTSRG